MGPELRDRFVSLLSERVRFALPLARFTSFRIGGLADVFAEPATLEELRTLLVLLHAEHLPFFLLGGGTNILVSDNGVRGVVMKLGAGFHYACWAEQEGSAIVKVGAANSLGRFVREAVRKGYQGVEFAEGIPGSVGGGLLMNAGAFGGELSRVVTTIRGVDSAGRVARLSGEEIGFAYRRTGLPPRFVVTEVELHLQRGEPVEIAVAMERAQRKRQQHQPHGYPNAGSIFKNPPGLYAGRLIEAAGLKGRTQGKAAISAQHANFIVNTGGASAASVRCLMEQAQHVVWEKHQVWLEPEVRFVGDWTTKD
ncbi:MAG: UDP-N-acetylmuramate dehydrogenase [Deltaproteobacteria bacterium]|nr:UDP-N-acetylmuramate dehydrogenase [Deltaproteobacteria bacterium]